MEVVFRLVVTCRVSELWFGYFIPDYHGKVREVSKGLFWPFYQERHPLGSKVESDYGPIEELIRFHLDFL